MELDLGRPTRVIHPMVGPSLDLFRLRAADLKVLDRECPGGLAFWNCNREQFASLLVRELAMKYGCFRMLVQEVRS